MDIQLQQTFPHRWYLCPHMYPQRRAQSSSLQESTNGTCKDGNVPTAAPLQHPHHQSFAHNQNRFSRGSHVLHHVVSNFQAPANYEQIYSVLETLQVRARYFAASCPAATIVTRWGQLHHLGEALVTQVLNFVMTWCPVCECS